MSPGRLSAMAVVVALAALAAMPRLAQAQNQRVVLDQATLEPSPVFDQARLRVFASAVDPLTGNVVPITGARAWTLKISGSEKKVPYFVTTYGAGDYQTAVAIVVETGAEYGPDLPVIQRVLDEELVDKLANDAQVVVFGYDEKVDGSAKWTPAKTASGKLTGLHAAASPVEPAMLDAVERALGALRKVTTDPEGVAIRKLLIIVSDGRDKDADRARTTRLGKRAAKDGVRIHSLAYSPTDTRRPLLALGELSRQSYGTFRWVRKLGEAPIEQSLRDQVKNLRTEIDNQYVLTYFLPADDVAGKKITLTADLQGKPLDAATSIKVPELSCGGATCPGDAYCIRSECIRRGSGKHRGVLGWIVRIGGIAVGAIVALGFIGFLLERRKRRIQHRAAMAAAAGLTSNPPAGFVPGSMPPAVANPGDQQIRGVPLPGFASQPAAGAPVQAAPPPQQIVAIVEGQSTATAAHRSAQPVLFIMAGPRAGQRLALRHGFVIGKDRGCDLQIEDGFASSQHAMILMDARGNCMLQDRGSTNGTFVNGVRVTEMALTHGMTIRIGSTDLRFLAQ